MQLEKFSDELVERDGIFFAKKQSDVSYPKEGNDICFQFEENSFWFRHRNNCITEAVRKYSPREIFFDIGGGNGFIAKGLEDAGLNTVLVEPGIEGCINAKKRRLKNIVCSTLENADFKKESIHSAGLFDVVEHIEEDTEFLKRMNSYLGDEGYVYITVPAYNILWSKEDEDTGHFRRYTIGSLCRKMTLAGFEIVYSTYIFSFLPVPIFFVRSLPSFLGLKKSYRSDEYQSEHTGKKSKNKIIDRILEYEVECIRAGKKIVFGGSCFVVGKKVKHGN